MRELVVMGFLKWACLFNRSKMLMRNKISCLSVVFLIAHLSVVAQERFQGKVVAAGGVSGGRHFNCVMG